MGRSIIFLMYIICTVGAAANVVVRTTAKPPLTTTKIPPMEHPDNCYGSVVVDYNVWELVRNTRALLDGALYTIERAEEIDPTFERAARGRVTRAAWKASSNMNNMLKYFNIRGHPIVNPFRNVTEASWENPAAADVFRRYERTKREAHDDFLRAHSYFEERHREYQEAIARTERWFQKTRKPTTAVDIYHASNDVALYRPRRFLDWLVIAVIALIVIVVVTVVAVVVNYALDSKRDARLDEHELLFNNHTLAINETQAAVKNVEITMGQIYGVTKDQRKIDDIKHDLAAAERTLEDLAVRMGRVPTFVETVINEKFVDPAFAEEQTWIYLETFGAYSPDWLPRKNGANGTWLTNHTLIVHAPGDCEAFWDQANRVYRNGTFVGKGKIDWPVPDEFNNNTDFTANITINRTVFHGEWVNPRGTKTSDMSASAVWKWLEDNWQAATGTGSSVLVLFLAVVAFCICKRRRGLEGLTFGRQAKTTDTTSTDTTVNASTGGGTVNNSLTFNFGDMNDGGKLADRLLNRSGREALPLHRRRNSESDASMWDAMSTRHPSLESSDSLAQLGAVGPKPPPPYEV